MPNVTPIFLLKTFNAVSSLVTPFTRGYKFTGAAVVTVDAFNIVTVDVTGASASAWDVTGNAGGGLILGTTTADDWNLIAAGLTRAGFKFSGEFFVKTHSNYVGSEYLIKTNGVDTTDDTLTTLFAIPVLDLTTNFITAKIQGRRDTGTDRGVFERKAMFYREGAGAVLSTKVHTIFTDKTVSDYDVTLAVSGNNLLIQVKGSVGHNISWTGAAEYQAVSTSA